MKFLTFLATAVTWLCILLDTALATNQNGENFGFGVELILAKLEQLENRIMQLEQNVNTSLEAMLKSPCSSQPGRLGTDRTTVDDDGFRVPDLPTRPPPYNNRPVRPSDYDRWRHNNSDSTIDNLMQDDDRFRVPNFPVRPPSLNNRPVMPRDDDRWRQNDSDLNYSYSYNVTRTFGSHDTPRPVPRPDPLEPSWLREAISSRGSPYQDRIRPTRRTGVSSGSTHEMSGLT